jgi:hypothetical protein
VVELTRLCALQEFTKCCTNTSLALIGQQSPVGRDLGQPHSWRTLVGPRAGQAVVIALTVQHAHQHMHRDCNPPSGYAVPGRSADWSSTTTRLDEREVIMVGRCLHLAAVCTHIPAWLVDLGPLIGKLTGDHPCSSMLPSALQASRADSTVSLTLTVPHFASHWKATLDGRVEYEKRAKKRQFSQTFC